MKRSFSISLTIAIALFAPIVARSEKADSAKKATADADSITIDRVTQTELLMGNVIFNRGTLQLKAGQAEIKSDPQGYTYCVFVAAPGGMVTFRQKRDGGDIWDTGEAERIEYDNRAEVVKMFVNAKAITIENGRQSQSAQAPYMSYDSRTESYQLLRYGNGGGQEPNARPRIVIEPPTIHN